MSSALFFIYDSHCPWSYACLPLVNNIVKAFPDLELQLFHSAYYQGDDGIKTEQIAAVTQTSDVVFSDNYQQIAAQNKDSVLVANLMAWLGEKQPHQALKVLNALMQQHFEQANTLDSKALLQPVIDQFKLSPPKKVLTSDKLTNAAEQVLAELDELQEYIGTTAIPALLLVVNDELILLNHNLYLATPSTIVEAVNLELANQA